MPPLTLTHLQRTILTSYSRSRTQPRWLVERARIILSVADGRGLRATAHHLGCSRVMVHTWDRRWAAAAAKMTAADQGEDRVQDVERLIYTTLDDAPRTGAPQTFTAAQVAQIIAVACEKPDDSDRPVSHWTPRELAAEVLQRGIVVAISVRTVGRFLDFRGGRPAAPPDPVLAHAPGHDPGGAGGADGPDQRRV